MCQNILNHPSFFSSIVDLDHKIANYTQSNGCYFCKSPLDAAHYPRKPRGGPSDPAIARDFKQRFSYCCRNCRKRHTPMSVRFLGRRVYLAVTVVLACAVSQGLTHSRIKNLESFGIPRQTLHLWISWWEGEFVLTAAWREISPFLSNITQIPIDPLMQLQADNLFAKLLAWLKMIQSLSVDQSMMVRVDKNTQSF